MKKIVIPLKVSRIIASVLWGGITLYHLLIYLLTEGGFLFLGFISTGLLTYCLLAKRIKLAPHIIGFLIMLWFSMFPTGFHSDSVFRYPFQKWYAEEYRGFDVSFLPEELPEPINDYYTEFIPPMLQGWGHYIVSVETDAESISEIKKTAKETAREIRSLEEYLNDMEKEAYAYIPEELETEPYGYDIYIMRSNYNFNHPNTEAILINEAENTVVWSIL
ncbi:MAG: hypothetical protein IJX15_03670 [Ruminiclostridium sp.]|nr:hypothetical protein [Ruminiclostridium sp.]